MINEYDHVKIKSTGVCGIVIDISESIDGEIYVVESDKKGVPGGWWGQSHNEWNLFDCALDDIEKIS